MSDSEDEAMIHDTLNPDEYVRVGWDLPTMHDGDTTTVRAVAAIGVSDAPIYLNLSGIAKLRAALDEAEAAFHRRNVKASQPVVVNTREEAEALAGKGNDFVAMAANMGAFNAPKVDVIQAPSSAAQDMSAAAAWAREQYAQGKRKLLIVHRDVPMPSPASRHPDDVAFRQGVGLVVAECCYGVTYKLIGYMRDDMEAAFCCAGVPIDVARHVARLVPTWTQEGRVNR